jgi:hypothetical protein
MKVGQLTEARVEAFSAGDEAHAERLQAERHDAQVAVRDLAERVAGAELGAQRALAERASFATVNVDRLLAERAPDAGAARRGSSSAMP